MAVKGKRAGMVNKAKARPARSASMKRQERTVLEAGGEVKEPKKPKQNRLPGMEDAKIDELHSLAEDYVDIRDRRMDLNKQETPLKQQLLAAMHAQNKTHYRHNGLIIDVVHENEKVRVKLTREEEAEAT
jgi:CRISPR/Cas system-associated exonuclease Cas4 (RecB family)